MCAVTPAHSSRDTAQAIASTKAIRHCSLQSYVGILEVLPLLNELSHNFFHPGACPCPIPFETPLFSSFFPPRPEPGFLPLGFLHGAVSCRTHTEEVRSACALRSPLKDRLLTLFEAAVTSRDVNWRAAISKRAERNSGRAVMLHDIKERDANNN